MSRSIKVVPHTSTSLKRPADDGDESSSLSPPPEEPLRKKSKKAQHVVCTICDEVISVRLLGKHIDLELERIDGILRNVSPSPSYFGYPEAGPSNPKRSAALKARQALNPASDPSAERTRKVLQELDRSRKERIAVYKELIALNESSDSKPNRESSYDPTCPVCLQPIHGESDMVDAHIDSCIAHANRKQEEEDRRRHEIMSRNEDPWTEIIVDGEVRVHVNNPANLRNLGVHVRDVTQVDIEEDVDVDGDSEDEYGIAQFTEEDVINPLLSSRVITHDGDGGDDDTSINIDAIDDDDDGDGRTLRDLVAEGKVVTRKTIRSTNLDGIRTEVEKVLGVSEADRMNQAILDARDSGDKNRLIIALENKVKQLESTRVSSSTSSICRICLDPYDEPTVSIGCWHTCCGECWLRCLGSTKLCPICKRITSAADLRRIYI